MDAVIKQYARVIIGIITAIVCLTAYVGLGAVGNENSLLYQMTRSVSGQTYLSSLNGRVITMSNATVVSTASEDVAYDLSDMTADQSLSSIASALASTEELENTLTCVRCKILSGDNVHTYSLSDYGDATRVAIGTDAGTYMAVVMKAGQSLPSSGTCLLQGHIVAAEQASKSDTTIETIASRNEPEVFGKKGLVTNQAYSVYDMFYAIDADGNKITKQGSGTSTHWSTTNSSDTVVSTSDQDDITYIKITGIYDSSKQPYVDNINDTENEAAYDAASNSYITSYFTYSRADGTITFSHSGAYVFRVKCVDRYGKSTTNYTTIAVNVS